jgi:hypothetical protein
MGLHPVTLSDQDNAHSPVMHSTPWWPWVGTLDLTITAEGVETPAQARALKEAGSTRARGIYLVVRSLRPELLNSSTKLIPQALNRG